MALGTRMVSPRPILVPRAHLTRGQRSATRGSGQIHIKLASDWPQRRLLFYYRIYSITMFLWYPVMDLARAPRRTARKKGSGYENGLVLTLKPWERGCLLVYGAHGPCGIFILFLFSFDFNLFLFCFFFILPMALMGHMEFSFYFYSVLILICFYFVSFLFYLWRSWAMWNFHFICIQF